MESLAENKILEFNPNTIQDVRKLYDLDKPGRIDEAIDLVLEWVKKQQHHTRKDYDREYLERSLIMSKGSVERLKLKLDKLCTLRTLVPQYFEPYNIQKDFEDLDEIVDCVLPKLTEDNYRVYMVKNTITEFSPNYIQHYYARSVLYLEYFKFYDYANGVIAVLDYTDLNILNFSQHINIMEFQRGTSLIMDGYGLRLKGIHIITSSKLIDILVTILKQALSKKVGDRIYVYKTIEDLHKVIPKHMLPEEYGGGEPSLKTLHDNWVAEINNETVLKRIRDLNEHRTNESLRRADEFNDQCLGMPGSFRTLSVD